MPSYVLKSGDAMSGALTLDKIIGKSDVNYGYSLPSSGNTEGRIFFLLPTQTRGTRSSQGVSTDVILTGAVRHLNILTWGYHYVQERLKIHVEEIVNESANTSDLTFTAFACSVNAGNPSMTIFSGYWCGELYYAIGSTETTLVDFTPERGNFKHQEFTAAETYTPMGNTSGTSWVPWTTTITGVPHNSDGSLSIKVGYKKLSTEDGFFDWMIANGSWVGRNYIFGESDYGTVQLTTINRGGYVRVSNGSNFTAKYKPYVRVGSSWVAADPYVYHNGAWVLCV